MTLNAQNNGADEIRIDLSFTKRSLAQVLKTLQEQYGVNIAYDHALVQNVVVALQVKNLTISQCLEQILANTPLTYEKVGKNYIIIQRPVTIANAAEVNTPITISGKIVDESTDETLPQATLSIAGTHISVSTNNDGHFTIFDVPSDTCTIHVRYLGYLSKAIRIKDLRASDHHRIGMKSDATILNEVVVFDEYNQAVRVENQPGSLVFNPKSLRSLTALGEQDISRTLQLLPGITATDESSSGMTIRGSHPSYNLTLLDGMTIYQQDHFFGAFSIINADVIKDVHLYKGMFDAKFGGRASGVIDITTKNGNAMRPSFNAKVNLINAKFTAEVPLSKKWSWFIGGRRSYTDMIKSKLFKDLFDIAYETNDQIELIPFRIKNDIKPNFYFFDINSKLTYRPSSRDVISFTLYNSRDRMYFSDSTARTDLLGTYPISRSETVRWGNNGMSLRWSRQWNERHYTTIRFSGSNFFRRHRYQQSISFENTESTFASNISNRVEDLSYAFDNELSLSDKLSVDWGVQGSRQRTGAPGGYELVTTGDFPDYEKEDYEFDSDKSWLNSLYGAVTLPVLKKIKTYLGARLALYHNSTTIAYIEPRANVQYALTNALTLKAGYTNSHQFITQNFYPSEMGTISGANENLWTLSKLNDPGNPVISSNHFTTGATLRKQHFTYDIEAFYKACDGVIIDEDRNSGTTTAYGVDVTIQKVSGMHRGWLAYTLSQSTQQHPFILNGQTKPSWQDQRHEVKIVNMLTLGNWNFSSALIYGSGKPYPKYLVNYTRDVNNVITDYALQWDHSNKSRLPSYFRIDFAATYTFQFNHTQALEIGLSIHNVTDHSNIKTRAIDRNALDEALYTFNEAPASYNDVALLGFSPSISMSYSF
ncbi:TonB-dependent receptor [Pseudochryseolinea flava]|uniref:TonB-dependent receptor n=1 Tax=Pseudochryseolinea flava TaxID=2059302 RepID=UPI001057BC7F|nr:TonB-dependent receptor [Pseudochryseolinea flava]